MNTSRVALCPRRGGRQDFHHRSRKPAGKVIFNAPPSTDSSSTIAAQCPADPVQGGHPPCGSATIPQVVNLFSTSLVLVPRVDLYRHFRNGAYRYPCSAARSASRTPPPSTTGRSWQAGVEERRKKGGATLEATQGQMDDFFSQLVCKCHLPEVASVGVRLQICPCVSSKVACLYL